MMNYEIACVRCSNIFDASEMTQIYIVGQTYHVCKGCLPSWKRRWQATAMESIVQNKTFWTPERSSALEALEKECVGFEVTEPTLLDYARRMGLLK